jgi:hypothetical protein
MNPCFTWKLPEPTSMYAGATSLCALGICSGVDGDHCILKRQTFRHIENARVQRVDYGKLVNSDSATFIDVCGESAGQTLALG